MRMIFILFLLNISNLLYCQENSIFKFDLLGSTIEEIIAIEGKFDEVHSEFDFSEYLNQENNDNFDLYLFMKENSYINRAFYDINRYIFNYPACIGYYFSNIGICNGCRYIMYLSDNPNFENHLLSFNKIYYYFVELYGEHRIKIIKKKEKYIMLELDGNSLRMELITYNGIKAQVDLWYTD